MIQTRSRYRNLCKPVMLMLAWYHVRVRTYFSYLADKFMCRISASLSSNRDRTSRNCVHSEHLQWERPHLIHGYPQSSLTGQAIEMRAHMRTEVTVVDS